MRDELLDHVEQVELRHAEHLAQVLESYRASNYGCRRKCLDGLRAERIHSAKDRLAHGRWKRSSLECSGRCCARNQLTTLGENRYDLFDEEGISLGAFPDCGDERRVRLRSQHSTQHLF